MKDGGPTAGNHFHVCQTWFGGLPAMSRPLLQDPMSHGHEAASAGCVFGLARPGLRAAGLRAARQSGRFAVTSAASLAARSSQPSGSSCVPSRFRGAAVRLAISRSPMTSM